MVDNSRILSAILMLFKLYKTINANNPAETINTQTTIVKTCTVSSKASEESVIKVTLLT